MKQQFLTGKQFENSQKWLWIFSIIWLLVIGGVAFFGNLGSIGLVDKTEPMFVEAARQMTVTGDWITPYWNGETRFDKPPLSYWLMAIAFKLIGVNEWAARLPSATIAIAVTGLGFYTLLNFGISGSWQNHSEASIVTQPQSIRRWIAAWIGSAIIALSPAMVAWGRTAVSDMPLAGCMSLALFAFFIGYAQPPAAAAKQRWYLAFYVFIAGAILAKGPVGLVLPVLIIAAFLFYLGNAKEVLQEMRPVRGFLVMSAIAVPWFVLVTLANGEEYINVFFGHHNIQRFTEVVSKHPGPWYFYFPVILVGLAPWSIYLPVAIANLRFWQRDRWRRSPRTSQLGLFALFWVAIILGFFSIAVTKLPSYVLPLMPAAAILVSLLFSDLMVSASLPPLDFNGGKRRQKIDLGLLASGIVNVVFLLAIAAASFWSPQLVGNDPTLPTMRQALQQSGLPIWSGMIWVSGAIAIVFLLGRKRWDWLWIPNLAALMAFMIFVIPPAASLIDTQRQLPLRQLSALVKQVEQPGEELIMIGFIKPSLVFYTQRTVKFFPKAKGAFEYLVKSQPNSVLLLAESKKLKKTALQPNEYQNLATAGAYQLLRLPKQAIVHLKP